VWHGLGIKACGLLMFGSLLRGVSVTVSKSTVIKNHLSVSAVIMKFVDIGANLTDGMYRGEYHGGSKKHEPDLGDVLERSWKEGLTHIIVTGGSVSDAKEAIQLAKTDNRLFTTVGCHPTRCSEFLDDPEAYLSNLKSLISDNPGKAVALGEFGLDYDRTNFCPKETQLKFFEYQLNLAEETSLPLFLHCRNAAADLTEILERNKDKVKAGGVVHSFDGTSEEAEKLMSLGYYIGLNGCSLRKEENLAVVKKLPIDRILIETDAPWCEIKNTHAGKDHVKTKYQAVKKEKWAKGSLIKGRNEPCCIKQVLEVICGIKNLEISEAADIIHSNTLRLFNLK